jgi:two-component flavin-dependent monooxygenase
LVLAVARKDCVIERTWASAGLHASGTDTVVVSGVTVPEHRTIDVTSMLSGDATAAERCHAAPAHLAGGLILAAVGMGAGRAGMAAWRSDAPQDAGSATALARSAAELNAAELVLADAARRADEEPITAALVARNRRDAAFAADLAVTATERLFRAGGAAARDTGSTVNRAWRDVHTVAAHGALRFDAAAQAYVAAAGEGNNG